MRSPAFPIFSLLAALAALSLHGAAKPTPPATTQKQPVIVELFTSEGCSDCPPAEELLKKLSELQPVDGVEIIALEEHVDYWNHQGWLDPYSSSEFTARQNEYASLIPRSDVYTPQMIVDGRVQFIGSRAKEALQQIQAAAAQPKPHLLLTLTPAGKPHTYSVALRVDPNSAPVPDSTLDLYIAVTEKGLHSNPTRGENSGASLVHSPLVRQLRKLHSLKLPLNEPVTNTINLKDNWNTPNLTVVAFLTNPKTHQVQAAGESLIPAP